MEEHHQNESMDHKRQVYVFGKRQFNTPDEEGKWKNLVTGRNISGRPKGCDHFLLWDNPRVAGPAALIIEFFGKNNLIVPPELARLAKEEERKNVILSSLSLGEVKTITVVEKKENVKMEKKQSIIDVLNIMGSYQRAMMNIILRRVKPIGEIEKKEEKSSDEEKKKQIMGSLPLVDFSFDGVKGPAYVVYISDGDTFDLRFFVPLSVLLTKRTFGDTYGQAIEPNEEMEKAIRESKTMGFWIQRRCRLFGVNAAEKREPAGPYATALLKQVIEKMNNIVYINCYFNEMYGRTLSRLYFDPGFTVEFRHWLCEFQQPGVGHVYKPYFGGYKEEF